MNWIAGFDIGGTQIKALAYDLDGQQSLETRNLPTRDGEHADGDTPAWAASIAGLLKEWNDGFSRRPGSVGISAPGLPMSDQQGIAVMPGRMIGLEGFHWSRFFAEEELFSPDMPPVKVLNDVQAALMAERWMGAAAGCDNVVMLTLGTGVGGAILCDGTLLQGAIGRAGHVGHLCLNPSGPPGITHIPGSLEDAIGNSTISVRSGGRFQSTLDLVKAAETGDDEARQIWETSVYVLACGIASLINVVDPERVIIGGGIAKVGDPLFALIRNHLDAIEWRPGGHAVQITPAQLNEWAGAHGAAYYAATTCNLISIQSKESS